MDRKNWLALSAGILIGVVAASAYWRNATERRKFLFDQNLKCQELAKEYETQHNTARRLVIVVGAAYTSKRDSCVAEVRKAEQGSIDYTVEDLISGDFLFYGHHTDGQNDIDPKKMIADQDAKFASLVR